MQYIRRRKIPQITGSADGVRTEVFCGYPVKYIIIRGTNATDEFSIEINGVEIINCEIQTLRRENGIRYGFDGLDENVNLAVLSFEENYGTGMKYGTGIRQLTFVARSVQAYNVTIVDLINI